jgi:hypothetical protein
MNHVESMTNRTAQHEQIEKIKREKRVHGGIINRKNVSKVKSQKGKKGSMENKVPPNVNKVKRQKGKMGLILVAN